MGIGGHGEDGVGKREDGPAVHGPGAVQVMVQNRHLRHGLARGILKHLNAEVFRENFARWKEVYVPQIYQVFSTKRLIVMEFIDGRPAPGDVLIAHAFLDLLPMPESLPKLLSLTNDLAWLTINFDGMSVLQPVIDRALDEKIERLYHATMDTRLTGGDSQSGNLGAEVGQDAVALEEVFAPHGTVASARLMPIKAPIERESATSSQCVRYPAR